MISIKKKRIVVTLFPSSKIISSSFSSLSLTMNKNVIVLIKIVLIASSTSPSVPRTKAVISKLVHSIVTIPTPGRPSL